MYDFSAHDARLPHKFTGKERDTESGRVPHPPS